MSGDCEKSRFRKLNMNEPIPLSDGIHPPAELLPVKWINVNGREEHEALLKDTEKCKELGLDQMYEIMVYLKRWDDWLKDE